MTKSWKRLVAEELVAFGKTGATIAKECVETGVSELGKCAGHKKPFKIATTSDYLEWSRRAKRR